MGRSIRVKLVVVYLLLMLLSMQLMGAYFVRTLSHSLIGGETTSVQSQAQLLATIAAPSMAKAARSAGTSPSDISPILSSLPEFLNGAVYLLSPTGVVIDTSTGSALIGQKRVDSVATQSLVTHARVAAIRTDPVTQTHLLAVTIPMFDQHQFVGIVEYVVPIENLYLTVRQVTTIFYSGSVAVLALTAILAIIVSRIITRPVFDVTRQARIMAGGDFSQRVAVRSDDEFGELASAVNDLTDKLEDALAANLREQERLQAVIKYMGDGVVAFDKSLKPIFTNVAALRLLPGGETGLDGLADVLDVPRVRGAAAPGDQAFIKDLGDALVNVHLTAILEHGEVGGYVAVLRDVTEQEQLNQARRDFVANVSHELRTPLTSIRSYIEALQGDVGEEPETRRAFLLVIEREADRMARLTQDLLQLSGLEMGNDRYRESAVDVTRWLVDGVQRFRLQADAHDVQLSLQPPVSVILKGDPDLLDRLLDNLLSNALKYTAAGGSVTVSTTVRKQFLELRIQDTGVGIPEGDVPHVFERFYRVDKARSRRKGGSGLGLALVREITERHGGRIHIESVVDHGTTVIVSLPLDEEVGK